MQYILADTAGFCEGVKVAYLRIKSFLQSNPDKNIYTKHPLVHNLSVMHELESLGLQLVSDISMANNADVYVVNAHGDPKSAQQAKELGMEILDTTCYNVASLQSSAKESYQKGHLPVLLGDDLEKGIHPEIIGIINAVGKGTVIIRNQQEFRAVQSQRADNIFFLNLYFFPYENLLSLDEYNKNPLQYGILVISDHKELERLVLDSINLDFLSQTTQMPDRFDDIAFILKSIYGSRLTIHRTICDATKLRQDEARELSQKTDSLVVIGGKKSSNTTNLAKICASSGKPTQHIETITDINPELLTGTVGITAGASTPKSDIQAVVKAIGAYDPDISS